MTFYSRFVLVIGLLAMTSGAFAQGVPLDLNTQLASLSQEVSRQAGVLGGTNDLTRDQENLTDSMPTASPMAQTVREQQKQIRELSEKLLTLQNALRTRLENEVRREEREKQRGGLRDVETPQTYIERPEDWRETTGLNENDLGQMTDARLLELSESLRMPKTLSHPGLSRTTRKIFDRMVQSRLEVLTENLEVFGKGFFTRGEDVSATVDQAQVPPGYILGPGDGLRITVWSDMGEESVNDVTVNPEGQIYVSPLGAIGVQGMTLSEFEQFILDRLADRFKHFKGQIRLTKVRRMRVFVTGEVMSPGAHVISALSTAFNALYKAGGPSDKGTMRSIRVFRGNKLLAEIDLYKYFLSGDRSQDIAIENGDTVFVPAVGRRVSISGEVVRPATYELKQETSLQDVVAMAGGFLPSAYTRRVQVARWQGDQRREMLDVPALTPDAMKAFLVQSGDQIVVEKSVEQIGNRVSIEGAVFKPGEYAVTDGDTVSVVIAKAGGLIKEEASDYAGQIIRKEARGKESMTSFDPLKVMSNEPGRDPQVRAFDRIRVFAEKDVAVLDSFVTISGAVRRPGDYIWRSGMTLRDLIFRAQGLSVESSTDVEVARIVRDKEAEVKRINIANLLKDPRNSDNMKLEANDKISVLARGDFRIEPEIIYLKGEVKRPGPYALQKSGETLAEIIERAGGLTSDAFPEGTIFKRNTTEIMDLDHIKFAQVVQDDLYQQASIDLRTELMRIGVNPSMFSDYSQGGTASGTGNVQNSLQGWRKEQVTPFEEAEAEDPEAADFDLLKAAKSKLASKPNRGFTSLPSRNINPEKSRIPVRLDLVLQKSKRAENIALRNGDEILVPKIPATISIIGAVTNPSNILFKNGANARYYINRVGGFTEHSAHARTLIVRANGEVYPMKRIRKIERGDIILVPPKPRVIPKKRFMDYLNQNIQIAQVLANMAISYKVFVQD
jgi:protein involved in polysaccharide export with SLBB domain